MIRRMKIRMKTMLYLFLMLGTVSLCYSFSFDDLRSINESCSSRGGCPTVRGNRLPLEMNWNSANCFCDSACINYGDCCLPAKTHEADLMKENNDKYECIDLFPFGMYYMEGNCKDEDHETQHLCSRARPESLDKTYHDDPFLDTPVTSILSDVTYKNVYCAMCNEESLQDIKIWPTQVNCPDSDILGEPFIKENLQFINNSWGIMNLENEFKTCDIFPIVPDTVSRKVRQCQPHIGSCSVDWTDYKVRELCQTYTTLVYGPLNNNLGERDLIRLAAVLDSDIPRGIYAFKNYHCAICNGVDPRNLTCNTRDLRKLYNPDLASFSLLFDFGTKRDHCGVGQIWDPFSRKCRQVVCSRGSTNEECSGQNNNSTIDSWDINNSTEFSADEKCDRVIFEQSEFYMNDNQSVVIYSLRKTYFEGEFQLLGDKVIVCLPNQYSRLMGWLTFFGLGLSCICLIIHLIIFAIVPDLKNLSGKNLASLCLALLSSYLCFCVSTQMPNDDDCLVLASVMYYSFLASFTWMNVMAFDIWRTLQMATTELRVIVGKQRKKFLYYSLYAWFFPAAALGAVLYIDIQHPSLVPDTLYPKLGEKLCWFGQKKAILVYFVVPVGSIMIFNLIFFVHAVMMVLRTRQSSSVSQSDRVQLMLYWRLALIMGISWTTGIVGGYLQNEYLWYVYILLNAFQGLFILLGFTCTSKVRKALSSSPKSKNNSGKQGLASNDSNTTNVSTFSSKSSLPSP